MIRCEKIVKNYTSKSFVYQALKGVDIEVMENDFLAILGPSGCGKSTLLNIMGFLDIPTSGQYYFKNVDASKLNDKERSYMRLKEVGFVFQSFNLLPRLSTVENIILPALYLGTSRRDAVKKADEFMDLFNMRSKSRNSMLELSGGEKQRVAIIRALINSPSLLLADEPTGNLDSSNANDVIDILLELNKKGMTVVMVTHDINMAKKAKRIIKIKDGVIDEAC
ncbi:MAG: ABC transporter ATP-binding protein [Elusimicrobia bacterium]|nr:ABC transporter ATP-binding protein [Elusimicrobiota bacterium]